MSWGMRIKPGVPGTLTFLRLLRFRIKINPCINRGERNTMFKGYRTYLAVVLAAVAAWLPTFTAIPAEISNAIATLLLAAAAYFRSKA